MRITLPWPEKCLTPNAKRRKHWRSYTWAIKSDRSIGAAMVYEAAHGGMREVRQAFAGTDPIKLVVTFFPPDRRKRDDDGMIGAFKHLRDGICDALAVNDSRFRPQYVIADPEKPGRVEVEFLA